MRDGADDDRTDGIRGCAHAVVFPKSSGGQPRKGGCR
jgi:hypothetical protein